jgi:hypothetical protein
MRRFLMIYLAENRSDIMSQAEGKYLESLRKRYAQARKKERGQILDEYVQTTGYHRKYAILVLSRKRVRKTQPAKRPRASVYTAEDARALEKVSDLFEGINAKLLRVALDNELKHLYDSGFLSISRACYERLKHISPATIDRLRQRHGRGLPPRVKRGHTKPGTLLTHRPTPPTAGTWAESDSGAHLGRVG